MTIISLSQTISELITEARSVSTLVVFDSRVSDLNILSQALRPGAIGFTINTADDGLVAISQLLIATGAKYLAIVAHGEPGMVHLGKTPINIQQLQLHSQLLQSWDVNEIALYSCEVAQGDIGKDLIYQLSELTGATVAASATKTGNPALGGNWNLAVTTGAVTAPIVFKSSVQTYQAVLAVSFATTNFALPQAGNGPNDIAVGDFNGDGILDIAIERYASGNSVSILLGTGAGSFAAPRNFSVSTQFVSSSSALAVGDFNGDNKLDVVTANSTSSSNNNTVSVLLGDGAGNIGAARNFATGSAPWKVVTGDFNNDGKLDIATANQYGNQSGGNFSVLLGDGIGSFSAPTTFSTPGSDGIYTVAFGDFNKDGKLDAVTTKYIPFVGYYLSTFVGNGAGGFSFQTDIPIGSSAPSIDIADFNGDGNLDVAAALSGNGDAVAVLLGNGVGGFGAATNFAVNSASRVKAGDFNGDGIIDLAVTSYSGNNSVSVLLGNGSGSFGAATSFAVGSYPSLAVGDFNKDGKLDFAAANYNDKNVVIGLNTSAQTPITQTPATRKDFNGDGKADILWRNNDGRVALWQMNGSTVVSGNYLIPTLDNSWKIASTGDFNGDKKSDILWRKDDGTIALWKMDGATVITGNYLTAALDSSWKVASTGDFDGDGKSDILWRNDNGTTALWKMDGATIVSGTYLTPTLGNSWKVASTGDFDGDGKADILWRNDNGTTALWKMDGATVVSGNYLTAALDSSWKVASTGDFDGDGKADILWRNDNGTTALWKMDGATVVSGNYLTPTLGNSWKVASTGDFDGDGRADILWRNDNGTTALWKMDGATVVSGNYLTAALDSSWNVAAPII